MDERIIPDNEYKEYRRATEWKHMFSYKEMTRVLDYIDYLKEVIKGKKDWEEYDRDRELERAKAENERYWLALRDIAYGELDADLMEQTARTALKGNDV